MMSVRESKRRIRSDRLAIVREKKRWYGLRKISKDENSKIKKDRRKAGNCIR